MKWLALVGLAASDRLLDQPVRRSLLDIIRRKPGIHASELCRETGQAWGTVQYHLGLLRKSDMVEDMSSGRERQFFPKGLDPAHARMISVMNQGRRSELAQFIQQNPGIRQVDICQAISISRKTFRTSIEPLVEAGLVTERKGLQANRYFPEEGLDSYLQDADVA